VQVARPNITNLRPAAKNLATAAPDLVATFHELNRFFNMGAYNPGGAEGLTGNAQQDAARNEGYLYWVSWLGQLTDSLFSTSDANGSFRRAALGFDCATIRSTVTSNPGAGPLIGLSNALNDTALCGGDNANQSFIPQVNVPPLPKGKQTAPVSAKTAKTAKAGGH
jgi:hypothetical protein